MARKQRGTYAEIRNKPHCRASGRIAQNPLAYSALSLSLSAFPFIPLPLSFSYPSLAVATITPFRPLHLRVYSHLVPHLSLTSIYHVRSNFPPACSPFTPGSFVYSNLPPSLSAFRCHNFVHLLRGFQFCFLFSFFFRICFPSLLLCSIQLHALFSHSSHLIGYIAWNYL